MSNEKPLLLVFDGNAIIHRAFHAIPALTVIKTGEMINGVQGFASILLKVIKEIRPRYWAIAFDLHAPTFRHKKFPEYKQQRPPTPPELVSQIARAHQLVEAFNIPVFEVEGFEADDIIATLGKEAGKQDVDTIIVTGDNDMLQTVSSHVSVLAPRRGFGETVLYNEEEVEKKYGIKPHQLIDYKALVGDNSDNIPGIKGIGDKTAASLLQRFGSLDNIYDNIDSVTPERIQKLLSENKEQAFANRELVTIVTDVPLKFNLDDCQVSSYERDKVVELFRELGFASLLTRLPEEFQAEKPGGNGKQDTEHKYTIINTPEKLAELVRQISAAGEMSVDLETSSLDEMNTDIVDFSLSYKNGEAYCIPVGHRGLSAIVQLPLPEVTAQLKPLLEDNTIAKIAQNGKFDITILAEHGMDLNNFSFDTMIAAYILGEKSLGLKALAFNKLGIEMKLITELIGTGAKQKSMADVDIEEAADYACADADMTFRLKEILEEELKTQGLWELFSNIEMPLVPVLVDMERTGVALDTELLQSMSNSMGADMLKLEADIYNSLGHQFNINSSQQLSQVLFEELNLPKPRKTKSGYSTDAAVLDELKGTHPMIEMILQYRQLSKLKSTYTDAFLSLLNPRTGRLHTSFNQTGTTTGRLSSSDPNLQNLPIRTELGSKIRQAIIPRPGWLMMSADYSQIDLRALAHISRDPELIATFLNDEDVHTATAAKVFTIPPDKVTSEMRRAAKTINFGVIYGMSDYGLEQATSFSREEASEFIRSYFEKYPGIKVYIENTKKEAREKGYVQTVMGRRRYIPELNSPNRQVREAAERMAINMPVQGTSADIIKIAMINIYNEINKRGLKSKMLLQVHDELVFEMPPEEREEMETLVSDLMRHALELKVPLKVDIKTGKNWGETK
jgi:DNA polymerase-1